MTEQCKRLTAALQTGSVLRELRPSMQYRYAVDAAITTPDSERQIIYADGMIGPDDSKPCTSSGLWSAYPADNSFDAAAQV